LGFGPLQVGLCLRDGRLLLIRLQAQQGLAGNHLITFLDKYLAHYAANGQAEIGALRRQQSGIGHHIRRGDRRRIRQIRVRPRRRRHGGIRSATWRHEQAGLISAIATGCQ
jgi:hypothetical protein